MHIERLLDVYKLTTTINGDFILTLRDFMYLETADCSEVVLDQNALERFGLPKDLEIITKDLVCTLETVEMPLNDEGMIDLEKVDSDQALIVDVFRHEGQVYNVHKNIPVYRVDWRTIVLQVISFNRRFKKQPETPSYELKVIISKEEFEAMKVLPRNTMLRVSLRVALKDDYLIAFAQDRADAESI